MRRSLSAALAAGALAALTLSACVPSTPEAGGGGDAERLTIATTTDVVNFNPLVGNSRTDSWVTNLMYPHLTQIDAEGQRIPYLATEWGYNEDGTEATVTIRDDMTWTDGEPVTADDVVFTINAVAEEQFGVVAGLITALESAEAVSDTEVRFNLSRPDGTFLDSVGFWMPIVPEHVFSQAESVQEFANDSDWVSAGPYVLTEADRGQRYVMERVENFPLAPEGTPAVDEVVFQIYPDVNTEVLALRNGEVDVIGNVLPPSTAVSLQDAEGIELAQVPSLGWAHLQYNMEREPLDDVRVRRALAHSVDYEAIREVALQGFAESTGGSTLTPTLTEWYDDSIQEYPYDPAEARRLLEEAGVTDLSLDMIYDQADANISRWAPLVRDSAAEAGITINLQGLERNTYISHADERDFDIYAGSWAVMDNPPANFALAFGTDGFINYANVSDPELDALIQEANEALTVEEALEPTQEAARIIHDQVYDNVLYVETFNIAYSSDWTGFQPVPSELLGIVHPLSLSQVRPAG
ncbi:ABC transporter substrate-binding protein [Allonocardiopsis opalescens]|uniref:Peptide/nickel transport system substrate-binding protein n=1 Tax=Allonocardiopsis opalescens TaxID=1144618 RepID=A0A2T0Q0F4_9ACTN|nr:ABC transporter substrate-binding protein [Allonocardiopsis opalescens]PRX97277.1 peptide/nickel transport system substrate-binding protein [Allonocardiopsis opalescens]